MRRASLIEDSTGSQLGTSEAGSSVASARGTRTLFWLPIRRRPSVAIGRSRPGKAATPWARPSRCLSWPRHIETSLSRSPTLSGHASDQWAASRSRTPARGQRRAEAPEALESPIKGPGPRRLSLDDCAISDVLQHKETHNENRPTPTYLVQLVE